MQPCRICSCILSGYSIKVRFAHVRFPFEYSFSIVEINKVRVNLFNLSTRPKMELPEPNGEKKIFQEKVFIPVQQHPEVSAECIASLSSGHLDIFVRFSWSRSFLCIWSCSSSMTGFVPFDWVCSSCDICYALDSLVRRNCYGKRKRSFWWATQFLALAIKQKQPPILCLEIHGTHPFSLLLIRFCTQLKSKDILLNTYIDWSIHQ